MHPGHRDQPVRGRVRQRAPQDAVGDGQDRRVQAQTQREHAHRQGRHPRLPGQRSRRVPDIVQNRLDHRKPRLVSERFLELRHSAEPGAGQPGRLGRRPAGAAVLRREQVEMHLDLLPGLSRETAPRAEVPQAGDERDDVSPGVHGSGDSRMRRAMTPAMRSQSSVWTASRRRPATVMT